MNISFSHLDIYKESKIVPYLEGESGIGKTSIIEQYAASKDMDCIIMGVASLDHIEFYGRTVSTDIVAGFNDQKFTVFKKSIPNWVSTILHNDKNNKETLLFILLGSVLIHILNIARIALLCMALYSFPEYEHMLHGVVFPLIIYGIVFLLWVIWVNKFSLHATTATKK